MTAFSWPDTRVEPPPVDHFYRSATWLLGRHPQLAHLVDRVPGVVDLEDQEPSVDLDALAEAVAEHDAVDVAWVEYERQHRTPEGDAAYEAWLVAGPVTSPAVAAVGVMSGSERTRLRLLACFAERRVLFKLSDCRSLDAAGQDLLADWCRAVCAA
jgi:hypothetical protein